MSQTNSGSFGRNILFHAALWGATALGVALRWSSLGESLWVDELHTSWSLAGCWSDVQTRAAAGNQAPLYFWLLWPWRQLGESELSLRLPSMVASGLLTWGGGWLVRQVTGYDAVGLLAALFLALDGDIAFFATEARPYALLQLTALGHGIALCAMLDRPTPARRGVVMGLTALAVHLHYSAILIGPATLVVCVVAQSLGWTAYRTRALVFDLGVVLLAIAPLAPGMLDVAGRREAWKAFVEPPSLATLQQMFPWWLTLVVPLAAALAGGVYRWLSSTSFKAPMALKRAILVLALSLITPLAIAWLVSEADIARLFYRRYLLIVTPAVFLLGPLLLATVPSALARGGMCLALAGAALLTSAPLQRAIEGRPAVSRGEDWRRAVAAANARLAATDGRRVVLVDAGLIEAGALANDSENVHLQKYCSLPVRGLYQIEEDHVPIIAFPPSGWTTLSEQQQQTVLEAEVVVLLARRTVDARASRPSSEYGDWLLLESSRFGRVTFVAWRRNSRQ